LAKWKTGQRGRKGLREVIEVRLEPKVVLPHNSCILMRWLLPTIMDRRISVIETIEIRKMDEASGGGFGSP